MVLKYLGFVSNTQITNTEVLLGMQQKYASFMYTQRYMLFNP